MFDPKKKLFKVKILRSNLKNSSNIKKTYPKIQKVAKICEKNEFYEDFLVLSQRFGDWYQRAGDSVCI